MATAEQYADWIVKNPGKRGTPEFETVAAAYKAARSQQAPTAYQRGRNMNDGPLGSMAQGLASVAQGPTFGFADEIGGAVGGLISALKGNGYRAGYRDTRDVLRGAADEQAAVNPLTTMLTRGMAAAPTMMFGGGNALAAPVSLAAQSGRATAIGAGTGGLGGLGQSTAEDFGGMFRDSAMGAATGGALSGASVPVLRMGGALGEQALGRMSGTKAAQYAREKVAEAFVRDARGTRPQSNPDGPFRQILARQQKMGDEGRLVDAGGQNARQLLDTLATLPGRTKDATETAIRSRQAGRADRLIGQAERSLGTYGDRAADVVEDLVRTRQQAATPLYGRLHQMAVQADPELADMLNAAETLGAGKVARDIATAQRVPYSLSADQWNANAGNLAMRDLDHMKQGLDQLIQKQTKPDGSVTPLGFRLQGLQRDLLAKLDDTTGGFYKQARDAFAGPSALISASDRGRRFLSQDDAATRSAVSGLSESEREAFRLGAFEALRNKLGRPGGQTEVLGMWKDKILREKLQAVFPDERAFRQFAATAAKEARMKGLESVGRGSQTASRLAGMSDIDVPTATEAVGVMTGAGGVPGVMAGASRLWGRVQTPEPVRDAMGNLLLSQGQAGRGAVLSLEETLRQVHQNRMLQAAGLGLLGGNVGGLAASGGLLGR